VEDAWLAMNSAPSAFRNTPEAWGGVAKCFHWLSALLILFLVAYGWWMTHLVERAGRLAHYRQHSVIGWYVLLLIALRLAWRAFNPAPLSPAGLPRWERAAAYAAHWTLYALMLVVSISGWMVADTFRQPIEATLFGVVPVPHLLDASQRSFRGAVEETHETLSYVLLGLVLIHVASALRHHFLKKNDVLRRMGWGRRSR
jgi:cytochrome b561